MPRNRVIYNVEALFVGPAPASGYHFIDASGNLNNNLTTGSNFNLIKNIPRIYNVSYNITNSRQAISQLGQRGHTANQVMYPPQVDLNFSYYSFGILNEARLGFKVNYIRQDSIYSGTTFYPDNFSVSPIDGFVYRGLDREENEFRWPMLYRDQRNIFIAISPNQEDLNKNKTYYEEIDPNSKLYGVLGFGNCYINSYVAKAAVGAAATVDVSYVAENVVYFSSGSGAFIPAVDSKDFQPFTSTKFALPAVLNDKLGPSVIAPGDISLSINSILPQTGLKAIFDENYPDINRTKATGAYLTDIYGAVASFSDLKIDSYSVNLQLPRKELRSVGYYLPIDRPIVPPVYAELNFDAIIGDNQTGSLSDILLKDNDFNITIKLNNPKNRGDYPSKPAIQYDFRRSKLNNFSVTSSVGSNKRYSCSFITEINPDDLTKGMFISGQLNINENRLPSAAIGKITAENGDFITAEDGTYIVYGNMYVIY